MNQTEKAIENADEDLTPRSDLSALPEWRADLSWAALLWERLWPALWPMLAVAGGYLLLALIGLPQALPVWAHTLLLALFALGLVAGLWWAVQSLRLPDRHAA
jgi:hypothetical protein